MDSLKSYFANLNIPDNKRIKIDMDYEKKYKDALEWARKVMQGKVGFVLDDVLEKFPELKESEDERIIKSLKDCFEWLRDDARWTDVYGSSFESVFAWLKKQGEQKSIDDLTQQEAMDIAVAKCFEQEERKPILDIEIPFGAKDSELQEASYHIPEGFHTEIEGNKVVIKKTEQKPAWSEEDENGLADAIWAIKQARTIAKDENDMGNLWYAERWLKSLRPKKQWKPSEEQMRELRCAISGCSFETPILVELEEQLKKLREE